jgi:hypothetical protein
VTRSREIEVELANLAAGIARTAVESVRARLVEEMEQLTAELEHVRRQAREREEALRDIERQPVSPMALEQARRAVQVTAMLRAKWEKASLASRQALMQWVVESVTLVPAPDDRKRVDALIVWRGGQVSRLELVRAHDRRREWDSREREVLRSWYACACWPDLHALLPHRSRNAIVMEASRLGLPRRSRHPGSWRRIPESELARLAPAAPTEEHAPIGLSCDVASSGGLDRGVLLGLQRVLDGE